MPALSKSRRRQRARFQYGVLPWRWSADGQLEVLLITSRRTHRWVLPKGWPIKGLTPGKSAVREAFEEAGLEGRCAARAFATYQYLKRVMGAKPREVIVEIFPMEVEKEYPHWPEMHERERKWAQRSAAAEMVEEPQLKKIILTFDPRSSVNDNGADGAEKETSEFRLTSS